MPFVLTECRLFKRGKLWLCVPIKTLKRWISFEKKENKYCKASFFEDVDFYFCTPLGAVCIP